MNKIYEVEPRNPIESLKQGCIQMKLIREGKLMPKRDWRTMFSELEREAKNQERDNAR